MMEFSEKSCTVRIDTRKCTSCETKACVEACRKYARGLLEIDSEGRASINDRHPEEVIRLGTECLACEFACKFKGQDAIHITVPVQGLDEYLQKRR